MIRILSGVIVCHVVGNNGVFPERGSRGPCVGFWGPGSIWQRMWYFCAKFLWIKGVFYHGLCVIIYAGRIAYIVLASHLCTCVLHRQLCYLHTLKLPQFFHFHWDFHQKWHFAHPEVSFVHPELSFLAKSMILAYNNIVVIVVPKIHRNP